MDKKHIQIKNPQDCCGCTACASICPKQCIKMKADDFGLKYPDVDESICVECGLCVRVCPFINPSDESKPLICFAAINKNENERMASSSGGIFIELCRHIIDQGGLVYGVVFDKDWTVYHTSADTIDGIKPMMGSKYMQSDKRKTFQEVKTHLETGKKVLYTGTPCEIAGLKHYLRKEYDNLLLVEVICHGAPAPGIWKSYLKEKIKNIGKEYSSNNSTASTKNTDIIIKRINFRQKQKSWRNYDIEFLFDSKNKDFPVSYVQNAFQNEYMIAFLSDWTLRPSCFSCKAKSGRSGADITIGDFWGIWNVMKEIDDAKGVSCVICRSNKAIETIENCQFL